MTSRMIWWDGTARKWANNLDGILVGRNGHVETPNVPEYVPDVELDYDADLNFYHDGLPFTGVAVEASPGGVRSETRYENGMQQGESRDFRWRARCAETRTAGSASGPGKRTEGNVDTAPRADSPTCGLTPAQSAELIARAWQVHACRPHGQRHSFRMPFGTAISMVLLIARHNLSPQVAADLFGLSQPTVSRIWRYLLALIGQVTAMDRKHLAQALERGVVLIDGTPIPTGNRAGSWAHARADNASSRASGSTANTPSPSTSGRSYSTPRGSRGSGTTSSASSRQVTSARTSSSAADGWSNDPTMVKNDDTTAAPVNGQGVGTTIIPCEPLSSSRQTGSQLSRPSRHCQDPPWVINPGPVGSFWFRYLTSANVRSGWR